MSRDIEKKRKRDRDRYHANAEEKRAYQRAYYAANKEILAQRRKSKGFMKVVVRTD